MIIFRMVKIVFLTSEMQWTNLKQQSDDFSYSRERGISFLGKPFFLVILMWMVYWIDDRYYLDLYQFGILPRDLKGLRGILFSPLLHGSVSHLGANSLPVLILGGALYYFYPKVASKIIIYAWIFGGVLVWIFGRENYHIGASGIIYSFAGFIFLSGILRWQVNLLALSFLIAFLYGSLFWGILPYDEKISWEGHLMGGVVGFALAGVYRKLGPARKKYSWELENEDEIESDEIDLIGDAWKQYSGEHSIEYHYMPNENQAQTKDNPEK